MYCVYFNIECVFCSLQQFGRVFLALSKQLKWQHEQQQQGQQQELPGVCVLGNYINNNQLVGHADVDFSQQQ